MKIQIIGLNPKKYYFNGELHRDDGPAIEYQSGEFAWYKNGQWHREDGPASFINGKYYWALDYVQVPVNTQEEFESYKKLMAFW